GHGAVVEAGRHALDAGGPGAADHLIGKRRGRNIDIADRNLQSRVADRAADHARFLAVAAQQFEHAGGRTGSEPGRVVKHARIAHFSTPRTNLPFSICAGMYVEFGGAPEKSASKITLRTPFRREPSTRLV